MALYRHPARRGKQRPRPFKSMTERLTCVVTPAACGARTRTQEMRVYRAAASWCRYSRVSRLPAFSGLRPLIGLIDWF